MLACCVSVTQGVLGEGTGQVTGPAHALDRAEGAVLVSPSCIWLVSKECVSKEATWYVIQSHHTEYHSSHIVVMISENNCTLQKCKCVRIKEAKGAT